MYESVQRIREAIEERLSEIDRELTRYDDLVHERELLLQALAHPPLGEGTERPSGERARRGENVERVLDYLSEHADATVNEIAAGTGIGKPVVHNTVRALAGRGRLRRVKLRSGVNGYRIATRGRDAA